MSLAFVTFTPVRLPPARPVNGADFYGKNPGKLRADFKKSRQDFLEVCRKKGIEPRRNYSGNLIARATQGNNAPGSANCLRLPELSMSFIMSRLRTICVRDS